LIHALLVAGVVVTVLGAIALPVNLAAFPKLSREANGRRLSWQPRVSVVIPARNEEAEIEHAVCSHLVQEYPNLQVVVVDDRSTDGTAAILDRLRREDARLVVVSTAEPPEGWLGKPHALWLGANAADGDLLLFADADVRYHPGTLSEAVTVLEHRGLDFAALFPRFETRGFWENVLIPFLSVGVFLGLAFLARVRRLRSLALGAGTGNLVRRAAYDAIGGHASIRNSVVDDVTLAIAVKRGGFHVGAFRAEDRIRVRIYVGFRGVWAGFTKNAAWVGSGVGGVFLSLATLLALAVSIVPTATLFAAAAGAGVPQRDVALAGALFASTVALRMVLAAALRDPLWPALTHPIMAAVWAGLIGRSLYFKFIRRRLTWRGREYDARGARF
jgi:chlorobactene glucosyltransferase